MTPQERFENYEYEITRMDMSYVLRTAANQVRVLHHFKEAIEKFHIKFPDTVLEIGTDKIEITAPERDNGQLGWFLQCFPGKYEKKPNDYGNGIDFIFSIKHPLTPRRGTFSFVASSVTPPPSCVIEEYDEVVPEHTIKKKKVVCKEGVEDQEPLPPEEPVIVDVPKPTKDEPEMTDSMQETADQYIESVKAERYEETEL